MGNSRRAGASERVAESTEEVRSDEEIAASAARSDRRSWRLLVDASKFLLGLALVLGLSGSIAWGAYRFAMTTSRFAIQKLDVEGGHRKSAVELARQAGIEAGDNLFALDVDDAERRLLEDPWIQQAKVTRRLPGTVRIEMSEFEAEATIALGGELFLVTRDGKPFKRLESGDPYDLTPITGVSAEAFAVDEVRTQERIARGLALLRQYGELALAKVHPAQELQLTADGTAILRVGRTGIALRLGHDPWRTKLAMAARVLGQVQARGQTPGIVFLDNEAHPERVVVRMH